MKIIIILLPICFFLSCQSQSKKFIEVTPENGAMDYMSESGTLGERGTTQVYFLNIIKEDGVFMDEAKRLSLKQGFLVVKLKRCEKDKGNKAYELLDSLNACKWAFNMNIGEYSNWPEDEKKRIIHLREIEPNIRHIFYNSVSFIIEQEALKTGISHMATLKYTEPKKKKYVPLFSSITAKGDSVTGIGFGTIYGARLVDSIKYKINGNRATKLFLKKIDQEHLPLRWYIMSDQVLEIVYDKEMVSQTTLRSLTDDEAKMINTKFPQP